MQRCHTAIVIGELEIGLNHSDVHFSKAGLCLHSVSAPSFVYLDITYGDVPGHNHFINFHGESCVRLRCDQSAHGWKYAPSPLMLAVAPLLFFDPVTQVQELHKAFVDQIACKTRWDAFSLKLKEQLQDSNLLVSSHFHCHVLALDQR
jgi:hypothetical protein